MNSYFVQHPEMILGEMKMVSGRFGPEATCEPFDNADLSELLNEAVSNIHGEISEYEVEDELEEEDNSIPGRPYGKELLLHGFGRQNLFPRELPYVSGGGIGNRREPYQGYDWDKRLRPQPD
jgi:hypothetical protein